jgi:hypothetical protein
MPTLSWHDPAGNNEWPSTTYLPTLNAMMSRLLGWMTVQPHLNPLKPESFVFALRESLLEHVPKSTMRARQS